jgi:hypothetical protein
MYIESFDFQESQDNIICKILTKNNNYGKY